MVVDGVLLVVLLRLLQHPRHGGVVQVLLPLHGGVVQVLLPLLPLVLGAGGGTQVKRAHRQPLRQLRHLSKKS